MSPASTEIAESENSEMEVEMSTEITERMNSLPTTAEMEFPLDWADCPPSPKFYDPPLSPTTSSPTSEAGENDSTIYIIPDPPLLPEIVEENNSTTAIGIEYYKRCPDPPLSPTTTKSAQNYSSPTPFPPSPPPKNLVRRSLSRYPISRPCADLLESRGRYFKFCLPLYEASITGNWEAAMVILKEHPDYVRFAITEGYDTALHVATSAEETKLTIKFVRKLVDKMTKEDLELQNWSNSTAFCLAAAAGNIEMVKTLMGRHSGLLDIGDKGMMPLYASVVHRRHNTARYLYNASSKLTGFLWTPYNRGMLLLKCVECHLFVCLITKEESDAWKLLRTIWANTIKEMRRSEVDVLLKGSRDRKGKYSSRMLFVATEMGNTKFVIELLRAYPRHIRMFNDDNHSIFHVAVMNRHHDIYNLLYEIGTMRDLIIQRHDEDGNNMFHLVGKTSVQMRPHTYSASLLMQRELLWFKEIENMMPPFLRQRQNKDGKTPYELFSEQNKDLVAEGLNWMKDCMIVATLIVTVAFAVAFTVPGGYNQEIGFPIFMHGSSFLVFVIADAISLLSSSISLIVFLSIFTSRHRQHEFMYALPRKLMIGLVALFISVAAMMVTFAASFFVLYHNKLKWVPMLIGSFAIMPVIIFAALEYPILVDILRSIYDSRYLFKPRKRMLYNTKPRL